MIQGQLEKSKLGLLRVVVFLHIALFHAAAVSQNKVEPLLVLTDANMPSLSFSGERVAVAPEIGVAEVYEVSNGKRLGRFLLPDSETHGISADGKLLRVFGGAQTALFDINRGKLLSRGDTKVAANGRIVSSVGLETNAGSLVKNSSPDLDMMATVFPWWNDAISWAQQPAVIVGRLSDHSVVASLQGPGGFVNPDRWDFALMTPDHRLVVSGRSNMQQPQRNITVVWDVKTGKTILSLPFYSSWSSISDDGKRLVTKATGDAGKIEVWDVPSGKLVSTVNQIVNGQKVWVSWGMVSPDGSVLVTARNIDFYIWDTSTGKLITSQKQDDISKGNVKSIAFSGDGKRIAIGSDTEVVTVWSLSSILSRVPNRDGKN